MALKEEIAQGGNAAFEFKEASANDSLEYFRAVGAFGDGRGWRTVSDTPRQFG